MGVRVAAPVRVLDAGGWTDTWFAGGGVVCNTAVGPGVEVTVDTSAGSQPDDVLLDVASLGDRYRYSRRAPPGRHPILEATIGRHAAAGTALVVSITSAVPPGSGMGTSAAVVVALIAALRAEAGREIEPVAVARDAYRIEVDDLGLQSGVQDQVASAHGGTNLLTIDPFPNVTARPLNSAALATRLLTVYLGRPHQSSAVHDVVIARLVHGDAQPLLDPLRAAARAAADAIERGDVGAFGEAMIANTDAQARLHPGLVSDAARDVFAVARRFGAVGWKVNGAGGDGGTVTIVTPPDPAPLRAALDAHAIIDAHPALDGVRIVDRW